MATSIVGTEIDKSGATLTIKHSDTLSFSPAYTFFLRRYADLVDEGNGTPCTTWKDHEAAIFWAENNQEIVGIFSYHTTPDKVEEMGILAINLTAVHPNYRGRGIHTILNKYFENRAIELGCTHVQATVSPKNTARLATAAKDGLKTYFNLMFKRVQD